jgi:hypothetical protein
MAAGKEPAGTIRQRTVRHHGDALPKIITPSQPGNPRLGQLLPRGVRNVPQKLEKMGGACASAASCAGAMGEEAAAEDWIITVTQMPGSLPEG